MRLPKIPQWFKDYITKYTYIHTITLAECLITSFFAILPIIGYIVAKIIRKVPSDNQARQNIIDFMANSWNYMVGSGELLGAAFAISTPLLYLAFRGFRKSKGTDSIIRNIALIISIPIILGYCFFVSDKDTAGQNSPYIGTASYIAMIFGVLTFYIILLLTNIDRDDIAAKAESVAKKPQDDLDKQFNEGIR